MSFGLVKGPETIKKLRNRNQDTIKLKYHVCLMKNGISTGTRKSPKPFVKTHLYDMITVHRAK